MRSTKIDLFNQRLRQQLASGGQKHRTTIDRGRDCSASSKKKNASSGATTGQSHQLYVQNRSAAERGFVLFRAPPPPRPCARNNLFRNATTKDQPKTFPIPPPDAFHPFPRWQRLAATLGLSTAAKCDSTTPVPCAGKKRLLTCTAEKRNTRRESNERRG